MSALGGGGRILIVDDTPQSVRLMQSLLSAAGYEVDAAGSGEEALASIDDRSPDLVVLDLLMPGIDGHEVCRRLRQGDATRFLPVIMLTSAGSEERIRALDAGADDFLAKPIDRAEMLARVRSLLRIKKYHDQVEQQSTELAELNRTLESRVAEQIEELTRLSRLRRFLSPHVAELITSADEQWLLDTHRREVAVLFCDLRGFTALAHSAEPEEVVSVVREFHRAAGASVRRFDATVGWSAGGDGLMVFFNDPVPCPDPAQRAVALAIDLQSAIGDLAQRWQEEGHSLGLGVGVALGYATMGVTGLEDRREYGPIGSVVNLASRLGEQAGLDEILVSQSVRAALGKAAELEPVPPMTLRSFPAPVSAWRVQRLVEPPRPLEPPPRMAEPGSEPVIRAADCVFRRDGEDWVLAFRGRTIRVRDSKGMGYLRRLLAAPGREIHVADLVGATDPEAAVLRSDAGPALDGQAQEAYKQRLRDLEEDRDEARDWGDLERAARAEEEIDFITRELSAAYGLAGRPRRLDDATERMRKAVTNRIRQTTTKIESLHRDLGRHLANSIRTGTFCAYVPEAPLDWQL